MRVKVLIFDLMVFEVVGLWDVVSMLSLFINIII